MDCTLTSCSLEINHHIAPLTRLNRFMRLHNLIQAEPCTNGVLQFSGGQQFIDPIDTPRSVGWQQVVNQEKFQAN
jgi:hypothetical protein